MNYFAHTLQILSALHVERPKVDLLYRARFVEDATKQTSHIRVFTMLISSLDG